MPQLNISTRDLDAEAARALADGDASYSRHEYDDAVESYEGALEKVRAAHGREHLFCALVLNKLGEAIQARDDDEDDDEAGTPDYYLRALAILVQQRGPLHEDLLPVLYNLISFYDQVGLIDRAERYLWRVKEIDMAKRLNGAS